MNTERHGTKKKNSIDSERCRGLGGVRAERNGKEKTKK